MRKRRIVRTSTGLALLSSLAVAVVLFLGGSLSVVQSAGTGCTNVPFTISAGTSSFPPGGGGISVTWSKLPAVATCYALLTSDQSWLTVPGGNFPITSSTTATAAANNTGSTRTGYVTVSSSGPDAKSVGFSQ